MEGVVLRRGWNPWLVATALISLPLLLNLCETMWRSPYPIHETVGLLQSYGDASPASFFDPTELSWYRPLYHLTWWMLRHTTGSLNSTLFWFKTIELSSVVVLLALLIWYLRPRSLLDCAAATCAGAVLVGTPGFRTNLELPLLMTLVAMPMALAVWMLLERGPRWWHAPVILVVTLVAIGFKEQGLVIAPLVVAAWWFGAPGATRTTTALVVAGVASYLAMRLATSGNWPVFVQDVELGFTHLPAAEASARFGAFPFWIYAYNGAATVANVLLSEPTDGRFVILWDVLHGRLQAFELMNLLSSTLLTATVVWWGVRTLRHDWSGPWSRESRVFIATVVAVAASGALGFNYSRERLGGMAVVFYALAAYFAVRTLALQAANTNRTRMVAAGLLLFVVAAGWQLRAIGTVEYVRTIASKNRREWIVDLRKERTESGARPHYVQILESMAPQGLDPSAPRPVRYPHWLQMWFGDI